MRHAFGLLLGILLTPALAYGSAWGWEQAGASFDALDQTIGDRSRMIGSFALLGSVGLVMGIVIVARWASPLVSLIPAVAFLAWTGYFLAAPGSALRVSQNVSPVNTLDSGVQMLLAYGVFGLIGFALLVPCWTPGRWSGAKEGEPAPEFTDPSLDRESPRTGRRRREFNAFD